MPGHRRKDQSYKGNAAFLCLLLLLFTLLLPERAHPSDETPTLRVRDQQISFATPPLLKDTEIYLPVRDPATARLFDLLRATFSWNEQEGRIEIRHGANEAVYVLEPPTLLLNGTPWDTPPEFLKEGAEIYFPLKPLIPTLQASLQGIPHTLSYTLYPTITGVDFQKKDGERVVRILASAQIDPTSSELKEPRRVVLDIPETVLEESARTPPPTDDELVKEIKIGQFQSTPPIVRVVMILDDKASYTIPPRLDLGQVSLVAQHRKETAGEPQIRLVKSKSDLLGVQYHEGKEGGVNILQVKVLLSAPLDFTWTRLKAPDNRLFIDFEQCAARVIEGKVPLTGPLVSEIRAGQFSKEPPVARVVVQMRDSYQVKLVPLPQSNQLIIKVIENMVEPEKSYSMGKGTLAARAGKGKIVVLDPGHGGSDPGTMKGMMVEKDLTLDIAARLYDLLVQDGYTVIMTRTQDVDVLGYKGGEREELQARTNVAEDARAHLFISLHINAAYSSWPSGISTHWYKAIDLRPARIFQKYLGKTDLADRGVSRNMFYVLRHSTVPAILVEMGFLTNSHDAKLLGDEIFREKLASLLRNAVNDYLSR